MRIPLRQTEQVVDKPAAVSLLLRDSLFRTPRLRFDRYAVCQTIAASQIQYSLSIKKNNRNTIFNLNHENCHGGT